MNKSLKKHIARSGFIRKMTKKENWDSMRSLADLSESNTPDRMRASISLMRKPPKGVFPPIFFNKDRSVDLSVIIPVYNVENYLAECLNALLIPDAGFSYEVIAVDDGSTDSSGDILNSYARSYGNLRVLRLRNAGVAAARNRGIELSKGKWIAFVDPDDIVSLDGLKRMMDAAVAARVDYAVASYRTIDESGLTTGTVRELVYSNLSVAWGAVYRSEIWETLRFPEGCWYEDTIIRYLVWPRFKGLSIPEVVYRYRQRAESIVSSTEGDPRGLDYFWITEIVIEEGASKEVPIDRLARLTLRRMGPTMLFCSEVLDRTQMRFLFLQCSEIIKGFPQICTDGTYWQELEAALRLRDYKRWLWCCLAIALDEDLNGAKRAWVLLLSN